MTKWSDPTCHRALSNTPSSPAPATTTTTTSTPAPTGTLTHVPTVSPYTLVGCWTEATAGRALDAKTTASGDAMTLEVCAAFCAGYKYFATEYAAECYCGNSLHATSVEAALADCSMPCSGDPFQYCGGPNRIELYETDGSAPATGPTQPATVVGGGSTWNFHQCVTEAAGGVRALSGGAYAADDMTLESCAAFCAAFAYFGTEYGRECYCGNAFEDGSVEAAAADCSMTCAGDAQTLCGNGNRLSVYAKAV